MVEREEVASQVHDTVEVTCAGDWFIAEGSYDGRESVAQGASREDAIEKLISQFFQREKQDEEREDELEFRAEMRETRQEIAEQRDEMLRDSRQFDESSYQ